MHKDVERLVIYISVFLFKGNQGFLNMLKQKFLKSSSKHTNYDTSSLPHPGNLRQRKCIDEDNKNGGNPLVSTATSGNMNATNVTNSANVTPEMSRRAYGPELRNEACTR